MEPKEGVYELKSRIQKKEPLLKQAHNIFEKIKIIRAGGEYLLPGAQTAVRVDEQKGKVLLKIITSSVSYVKENSLNVREDLGLTGGGLENFDLEYVSGEKLF